jgi:hypothetical protein
VVGPGVKFCPELGELEVPQGPQKIQSEDSWKGRLSMPATTFFISPRLLPSGGRFHPGAGLEWDTGLEWDSHQCQGPGARDPSLREDPRREVSCPDTELRATQKPERLWKERKVGSCKMKFSVENEVFSGKGRQITTRRHRADDQTVTVLSYGEEDELGCHRVSMLVTVV